MSKGTDGDHRHPQPGHPAIYDDWQRPRPESVTVVALGYGKDTYPATEKETEDRD